MILTSLKLRSLQISFLFLAFFVASGPLQAQDVIPTSVDVQLIEGASSNQLLVQIKTHSTAGFGGVLSALTLTIRYDNASGAALGGGATFCNGWSAFTPSPVVVDGGIAYRTYNGFGLTRLDAPAFDNGCETTIAPETWFTITTIPVAGGGCTAFTLGNDAFTTANNRDFFISMGGEEVTGAVISGAVNGGVCALDCLGVPGGTATIGSSCDDGNANTGNDVYDANCDCVGQLNDCLGVPGGTATIGSSCDDGNANTGNDVYDANCDCVGQPIGTLDCEGVLDGPALPGTACDDENASTTNDTWSANCTCLGTPVGPCSGDQVVVAINTDGNPDQLTWEITDESNVVIAAGGPAAVENNMLVSEVACLGAAPASACYGFRLYDSFGDGISGGNWQLRTMDDKVLLGDDFPNGGDSPSLTPAYAGYTEHSFCLPPGPAQIANKSCDIFNYTMNSYVYCRDVAGATSYQFEFSDPDAGFIRRIAVNTNKVRFNQMNTSPLTPGVKYFVRARTNDAGPMASAHFSTGCEVGMSVPFSVTCSELISAPTYGHSCNESRAFNTNNSFIYATPVVGATEYQFRISIPGEGYDETFIRSTYILQLKWNNHPPMVNGSTYNVQVNVKVGTLYSGFCGDVCTITIDNSGNRPEAGMAQTAGTATMWPNPVREGQVNLTIDGIRDAEQNITVDIQDIYGKQVFAKEFGNSGEHFTTILDLPGDIASGVYMVNIVVNGQHSVQRLSIIK